MDRRNEASARNYFGKPKKVIELAFLAAVISPAVLVITTAGTTQVLSQQGNEALPFVYVLLAAVSIPVASGISTALGRWPTLQICRGVCWASLILCLLLRGALALALPGAPQAMCIAAYVLEIVFDTLFWLTVSEYLTTLELKRHAPFLAMAFGASGIFGGFLTTAFCAWLPADDLLLLNAALFAFCVAQFVRVDRRLERLASDNSDDEESGIIDAVRSTLIVLRSFPLTGAVGAGILLMSSLFCLQDYLALTIYSSSIPDEDSLASFMGMACAGQQAAELLILAVVGRVVLERAGPLVRNLFFPATTFAVLAALQSCWTLPLALLVHINANSVSNAIFEPVKNLNYAALPFRMLAPVRMLVEGVVYPAGIALSGGALLWMQSAFAPQVVLGVALVLSVLFAAASGLVGLSFLPSLLRSLRLRAVSPSEYSNFEPGRRFSQSDIRYLLLHPDEEARRFGRDLARRLAPHLLRAEGHGRSSIWAAAATAIGELAHGFSPEWSAAPGLLLSNGNGSVRFDVGRVESGRWCAVRTGAGFGVRHRTGQRRDTTSELADMGRGLEHAGSGVRRTAAWLLARNGDAAVSTAAERLHSSRPEVVEAAIQALGAIRTRKAQRVLRDYLRPLYQQARLNLAALQHLTADGLPESARNDLAEGLADSNRRIVRKVLAVKSALGNRRDINLLLSLTQTKEPRVRSDAVEALTSLPTGRLIRPVLPLLHVQQGSSAGNVTLTGSDRANAADPAVAVWRAAADDRWLRLLAARLFGHRDQETAPAGDDMMLDLILFLKSVPLFRAASFEDIARIADKTQTVALAKGEALFSEGESVTHIYVVRSGSIELSRHGLVVEIMQAGTSMGEHAILGDTHHEVSARAASESHLLRFPAQLFADLVAEHPESLGPVVGDLVRRVNMLHGRLAETRGSPQSAAAHRFGSSGRAGGRAPTGRMAMA